MNTANLLSAVIGASLCSVGCATALPVVRLAPRDANVTWVSGRAVTVRSEQGIRVAAAFERQAGRTMGFRVELQNDSDASLVVDPSEMQFTTCTSEQECVSSQPVVDPEQVLVALDEARSEEEAHAANASTTGTVLVLLAATADIAEASSRHDHHAGERTVMAGIDLKSSESNSRQRLAQLETETTAWSNSTLRRTTVAAGHGAAGLVYIPLDTKAHYVWLDVRVGGHDFWFPFQQLVATVRPHTESTE